MKGGQIEKDNKDKDDTGVTREKAPSKGTEGFSYAIIRVIKSFFNIDLLSDANEDLSSLNWYTISITTLSIGVFGLTVWSLIILAGYGLNYILASQSLLGGINRVVQVGPFIPVVLFVFAIISKRSINRLQKSVSEGGSGHENRPKRLTVFLASLVAFVAASIFRWSAYQAARENFGTQLSHTEVMSLMVVDGGYISLLLIGCGALGSLVLEPSTPETE